MIQSKHIIDAHDISTLKKRYIQREILQQRETTQIFIYLNDITTNY